ncbi:acyl-CoA thioester hydrolase/BAAT C-terminal domain-containing protein [Pseudoalteromonas phenolica]|uniref:acyl-CoA thioester hydrolase/BAAT C-terminal domain-containing protein n=1 Tax=Pseudoalteromonas phenolica TaxID=161398 RepID=UPI00110BC1FE|nr:acyl-CoA thioester hydrolase/BAAT C-terminal domain-containing protein [Pseudoalteromonas phenolica]TMO57255.1 acyl-CoA thioester hydrolase [Pseudoalteromonas phenolica]
MKKIMPCLLVGLLSACSNHNTQDVKTQFIDDGKKHPLVILLGGSDGGNTLANPHWQPIFDRLNEAGVSVASLGYFGTDNTPSSAAELSLEEIEKRISLLAKSDKINNNCVAVFGFSKGAELALLLGSHFDSINHVVAVMPSHVTWNAVKTVTDKSSWTLKNQPLAYINAPLLSWQMQKGNVTGEFTPAFEQALAKATEFEIEQARIPIDKNKGPVLLVSAKQDEIWPSYDMANEVMKYLEEQEYEYAYEHIALEGSHYGFDRQTLKKTIRFLLNNFPIQCD